MRAGWITVAGVAIIALAVACSPGFGGAPGIPAGQAQTQEQMVMAGQQLFMQQCAACHTINGMAGANGTIGPNLTNFASQPTIMGVVPNTPQNVVIWLTNPQQIKPGTTMPTLGLTPIQVQQEVAFLETLK